MMARKSKIRTRMIGLIAGNHTEIFTIWKDLFWRVREIIYRKVIIGELGIKN
jgi:hypothetical protein